MQWNGMTTKKTKTRERSIGEEVAFVDGLSRYLTRTTVVSLTY